MVVRYLSSRCGRVQRTRPHHLDREPAKNTATGDTGALNATVPCGHAFRGDCLFVGRIPNFDLTPKQA